MERAIDPLLTIDAKLWADEFMATKQRLGDAEFDHAMMLGWFANAIMRGYDAGRDLMMPTLSSPDAQATIAALQAQITALTTYPTHSVLTPANYIRHAKTTKKSSRHDCPVCRDCGLPWPCHAYELEQELKAVYAQLTQRTEQVAALQSRVKELEQWVQDQSTANLETMRHVDEMQSRAMEAESQLTQRTAECDALKLVNDTHMKTVMKLSHVVEKHTAELEVAKGKLDIILRVSRGEPDDELAVDYGGLGWENDPAVLGVYNLIAELQSAEAGYFVAERDLRGMNNKYDELRTLIAALPKVEGEIEVVGTTVRWGYGHSSCMDTRVESEAYAALLQHRQGMEG